MTARRLTRFKKKSPDEAEQAVAFDKFRESKAKAELGKEAEGTVKNWGISRMKIYSPDLDFWRVPDAKAAGGKFPAQTGDFAGCYRGHHFVIEVKETAVVGKLPAANMDSKQLGRMEIRRLAGASCIVLVRHTKPFESWVILQVADMFGNKGPWSTANAKSYPSADKALDFFLNGMFNNA